MNNEMITDTDRYPTLTEPGRQILKFMAEHPYAPIYRNKSGNRLLPEDIEKVRWFEAEALLSKVEFKSGEYPDWLDSFILKCFEDVPFYRQYGSRPNQFEDIPAITRADLGRDIAKFVPDSIAVDRLINFRTSGTTGHPLLLASHPIVAANYLAFHKKALRRYGIELTHGEGKVGVVLIGYQTKCFTYISVTPTMNESGLAKINLHPCDWRDPDDRAKYLDALNPEVYAGDPISFAEMVKLPLQTRPRALLCTSMMLLPGLRKQLESYFDCPVLDLYSMNEAGPIAVADPQAGGHVLLQHCMYVEIIDSSGCPLPPGQKGEITLTGGFNFCLPLLRYRTGDFASLSFDGPEPVLIGLQGRLPIRFRTIKGEMINNIEITHAFREFPIHRFTVHQVSDGKLHVNLSKSSLGFVQTIRTKILELFGLDQPLEIQEAEFFGDKMLQYTSDIPESQL